MISKKDRRKDAAAVKTPAAATKYQPPRVEKGRRLADVTGQGAVVPSGAPLPG